MAFLLSSLHHISLTMEKLLMLLPMSVPAVRIQMYAREIQLNQSVIYPLKQSKCLILQHIAYG